MLWPIADGDNIIGTTSAAAGETAEMGWSGLSYSKTYNWYVTASDGTYTTKSPTWKFTTRDDESENMAPHTPDIPIGPNSIDLNVEYEFDAVSFDPDYDDICYRFDWGDGTYSDWIGSFESGEICTGLHVWVDNGTYQIKVKAKDNIGDESNWSDLKVVNVVKNKSLTKEYSFFEGLFDMFPFLKLFFSNFRFFSSVGG